MPLFFDDEERSGVREVIADSRPENKSISWSARKYMKYCFDCRGKQWELV
jgi:hypothetical protein